MQNTPQYACPRCGAPIQIGQQACTNCGLALDAASIAAYEAERARQPPPGMAPGPTYAPPGMAPGPTYAPPGQAPGPVYPSPVQVSPTYTPSPPMPPRTRPAWLVPVIIVAVLLCGACGLVSILALSSQNETARQAAAQATLTALAIEAALPVATPAKAFASPTAPSGPTATLRPDEADVHILDFTNYDDSLGNLIVIGQVQNTGHGLASDIKVTAEGLDAGGASVASGHDLLLALVGLPPGAKAPFQISLGKPTGDVDKIHVTGTFKTFDSGDINIFVPAAGLSIEGDNFAVGSSSTPARATGRVKNGGSKGASLVHVLATGYDAQGNVVAVELGTPENNEIAAGATSPFTIDFFSRPDADITRVDLLPTGNEAP